jgi:hypothetical protein
MKSTVFWDVMPYNPPEVHQYVGRTYCLHLQGGRIKVRSGNKQTLMPLIHWLWDMCNCMKTLFFYDNFVFYCSIYSGHHSILIPPSEVEVNPALWLTAVSQYRVRDTFCSYGEWTIFKTVSWNSGFFPAVYFEGRYIPSSKRSHC